MTILETAPAKINLALHVRARRADGYHALETLFAFLRHGDEIRVARDPAGGLDVTGPFGAGLAGHDNLVGRAAAAFADAFAPGQRWAITLDKRLPIASGIGGGSADAAATLRALARLEEVALDDPALFAIADALGSDVPACLASRSALGTGRGEQLTPVEGLADIPVLLVNPGVGVSTAAVFAGWGGVDLGPIAPGDPLGAAIAGRNDLQPPALTLAPVIAEVLDLLDAQPGVRLSRMSGSGATCFALFDRESDRRAAAGIVAERHPDWWCLESRLV